MKTSTILLTTGLLSVSLFTTYASAKGDVLTAAEKLADAGGYSWKSNTEGGFGGGEGGGKVAKDGTAVITIPRRDGSMTAVLKGDNAALETDDGWQSLADLEDSEGFMRFFAMRLRNTKLPAQEVVTLAKNSESLKEADGVVSGKLTEAGVTAMVGFGGRGGQGPSVSNAKGSVRIWIKNGMISKYQYSLQYTFSFNGNDRDSDRTTTIEISNAGSTTVEVPEGAKKKLS